MYTQGIEQGHAGYAAAIEVLLAIGVIAVSLVNRHLLEEGDRGHRHNPNIPRSPRSERADRAAPPALAALAWPMLALTVGFLVSCSPSTW